MNVPKTVQLRKALTLMLIILLASVAVTYVWVVNFGSGATANIADVTTRYYNPDSTAAYIIGPYNSSFYYLQNHTGAGVSAYGGFEWVDSSDTSVFDAAMGNLTDSGGSVFIKAGSYSGTLTVRNYTRAVIEKGAVGITVAFEASATCTLEDYENGVTKYYSAGTLVTTINHATGLVDSTYGNFTQFWTGSNNRTDAVVNPISEASYIVDVSGSTYRMKNGTTGQIDYSSTNASAVINNALGNLTSGRIWRETIVLKGNFSFSNVVTIPSYTTVILNGKISLANNVANNMEIFYVNAAQNVTIKGDGVLDGNAANQAQANIDLILVSRSQNVIISDLTFQNSPRYGVNIWDGGVLQTRNIRVQQSNFFGIKGCSIIVVGSYTYYVYINDNFFLSSLTSPATTSSTIYSEAKFVYITGNQIVNNQGTGVNNAGIGVRSTSKNFIEKNIINGSLSHGILFSSVIDSSVRENEIFNSTRSGIYLEMVNSTTIDSNRLFGNGARGINIASYGSTWPESNLVTNNYCLNNTDFGIGVGGNYTVISNNHVENSGYGSGGTTYGGIAIQGQHLSVSGNMIIDTQASPTQYWGVIEQGTEADFNLIVNNQISGSAIPISTYGTNTKVWYNIGFVTENSGSWSGSSPVTVAHGLAGAPDNIQITVYAAQSYRAWISAYNSTYITIMHDAVGSLSGFWEAEYVP